MHGMNPINHFAYNLRTLREGRSLSQKALAAELGISRSALGSWERGDFEPPICGLINVAKFFGVTVDTLLKGDVSKVCGESWADKYYDICPHGKRIWKGTQCINPITGRCDGNIDIKLYNPFEHMKFIKHFDHENENISEN
jgi:transcriptional regulator with XRE-family HTH domain